MTKGTKIEKEMNGEKDEWVVLPEKEREAWISRVRKSLLAWYEENKRPIPWRLNPTPYFVWLGEIMAQQTRIAAVLPYYERFLQRFPTIRALTDAPLDDVLKQWQGLGYYSRARNLHRAAQMVETQFGGIFPSRFADCLILPGVGPYTAAAIASIVAGERVAAVDGNALRVVSRIFGLWGDITQAASKRRVADIQTELLPIEEAGKGNQAVMELGALCCLPTQPHCEECPATPCKAKKEGWVNQLPVKARKAKPTRIHRAVAILRADDGRYLMRKRPEALLHGLWEFPGFECKKKDEVSALQSGLAELGVQVQGIQKDIRAEHVFSHRIWEMQGYRCETAVVDLPPDYRWVSLEEMNRLAIPRAVEAFRWALQGEADDDEQKEGFHGRNS